MTDTKDPKVLGVVVADFERSAVGTCSRLGDMFAGRPVLGRVIDRLSAVRGVQEVVVLVPGGAGGGQMERAWEVLGPRDTVRVMELQARSAIVEARVRRGRAWNLQAWRGGAGQWTCFDEEYHPAAIAQACAQAFADEGGGAGGGTAGAEHVLVVPSHAVFLDVEITSALVHHHLHKNHEMRVTYTPAAPGFSGMVLRADIVREMGEKNIMPWQLLAYDPKAPSFDTLIREACMQVDPALSKIPNRFCVDTERSWQICELLGQGTYSSAAELALAAARVVAPGVRDFVRAFPWPREVEIELTGERLTTPPGTVAADVRQARGTLDAGHWCDWFARQAVCDDLLVTFGGDGDPLLYPGLVEVLRAARKAGVLGICVQTDLVTDSIDPLLEAVSQGLVDVVGVTMHGHMPETYAQVAGVPRQPILMKNMERLAAATRPAEGGGAGGGALVIPRLLKVRETIPEMEAFFDFWIERCGWAVIDGPSDRAGSVPFGAVVDMAPPRRRPCRRLWERLLIRANGVAVACDQDARDRLALGSIEKHTLQEMWQSAQFAALRQQHAAGLWATINPCQTCREWHRP